MSNNSSGMCCGVAQNTYHTLKDMRVVLADGSLLDTADPDSRAAFLEVRALTLPLSLHLLPDPHPTVCYVPAYVPAMKRKPV